MNVAVSAPAKTGTARMAVAQPPGSKAVEVLHFDVPDAGKAGPFALQVRNKGLFDEYAEAKKAETEFTRALSAFEKRLAPLIPEPVEEPEPLEAEPTTPEIEEQDWYSHCLLLARTRGGKTNAIRWRIRQLLPQIAEGRASLILMEPKGPLIDDVLHLRATWKIRDRLVIIDPRDIRVSVNIFGRSTPVDLEYWQVEKA